RGKVCRASAAFRERGGRRAEVEGTFEGLAGDRVRSGSRRLLAAVSVCAFETPRHETDHADSPSVQGKQLGRWFELPRGRFEEVAKGEWCRGFPDVSCNRASG